MDYISIEKASYRAWPAFEQVNFQGWILRFTNGFTKRANSANVIFHDSNPLDQKVIVIEEEFNNRNLPCIFRLLSFNDNCKLESILDSRGYYNRDHSLVLVQDLKNKAFETVIFERISVYEWIQAYCQLSGKEKKDHDTHVEMINRIKDDVLLAILQVESQIVSCGLGVVVNDFFGIFDIVTHQQQRNKGYGTKLIKGMLSWATRKGAVSAYVQVASDNKPAVKLYEKLGYEAAYEYHYKIQY